MPIYEYECKECQAISTFLVLKKEDDAKVACKGVGVKKCPGSFPGLLSSFGR